MGEPDGLSLSRNIEIEDRLGSWKEIASYLQRHVKTVYRWERNEGLPVHRHSHDKKSTVYAYRSEIDAWLADRGGELEPDERMLPVHANYRFAPYWKAVHRFVRNRRAIALSVTALAACTAVGTWTLRKPAPALLTKFVITPPPAAPLANTGTINLAISPDGKRIVYVADHDETRQLYLRSLDEFAAKPIAGTEGAEGFPFFSPDGQWLGFFANGEVKKVPLQRGFPTILCSALPPWRGGAWNLQGTIVFASGSPMTLYRVSAGGGEPEVLAAPDQDNGEVAYSCPKPLPQGNAVLFDARVKDLRNQVRVLSLDTGEQKILLEEGLNAYYAPTGHLVYQQGSILTAIPFDLRKLEVSGLPLRIFDGIRAVDYALSSHGTLIYIPFEPPPAGDPATLVWVDRQGKKSPVIEAIELGKVSLSPDGKRIALVRRQDGHQHVWVYEPEKGLFRRLTSEGIANTYPIWTPDGMRITFASNRGGSWGLYRRLADGSRPPERLTTSDFLQTPWSWSPDGKVLVFNDWKPEPKTWILPGETDARPRLFASSAEQLIQPAFSPNGRWLAYCSSAQRSPRAPRRPYRVYVSPYPKVDVNWLVSGIDDGRTPLWSPDGKELFYLAGEPLASSKLMVVPIEAHATFKMGAPKVLFEGSYLGPYGISHDGKKLLMIEAAREKPTRQINVVLNWHEDLMRVVDAGQ